MFDAWTRPGFRPAGTPARRVDQRPVIAVVLAAPRGFCAGVHRAIDAVRDALAVHGPPIYVRRAIVHNLEVVRQLEAEGAVFVQNLDAVPRGSVVIFSAHGVAPAIARDASRRGLVAYDAVCPLVAKVHREVERHQRGGRQVVLIGHAGHPEIEGTLGHARSGTTFVVNSVADVEQLPIGAADPTAYAVQTTYSVEEAAALVAALQARFSDLAGPASTDICYATTNRQQAVKALAAQADALIIAGESFSSNASRLAEVAAARCPAVQLVGNADQIDWGQVSGVATVGVAAAASTPESTVQDIVAAIGHRFRTRVSELEVVRETTVFKRVAIA